ncbi:MAG: tyrosine-type recombinase/integrase, partial [Acidimicrobiales bacterium]
TLPEVAQVLRHSRPDTTARYAKVDHARLDPRPALAGRWAMRTPDLRARLDEYLALRRSLGFKLRRDGLILAQFVDYCEAAGITTITTEAALAWAKLPEGGSPYWWAWRLSIVRVFATYLQALDPATEVPPKGLLPAAQQPIAPYPYTEHDIVKLMEAATRLRYPLHAVTYQTLIGLLAVTGMRVGEAIALDRSDLRLDAGLLVIRNGKFAKSRELPLHPTTVAALRSYARRRGHSAPSPRPRASS